MKLIIDIPEENYKNVSRIVDMGLGTNVDEALKNGTLLDDVKTEIQKKYREVEFMDEFGSGYNYAIDEVLEVLDNISKVENEDKE